MELIDKQAALDIVMRYCPGMMTVASKASNDLGEMLDEIEGLPIVHIDDMTFKIQNEIQAKKPSKTVEITFVRHGRWIPITNDDFGFASKFKCTYCRDIIRLSVPITKCNYKYCPNCGAQIDLRTQTEVQLDEADSVMMGEVAE